MRYRAPLLSGERRTACARRFFFRPYRPQSRTTGRLPLLLAAAALCALLLAAHFNLLPILKTMSEHQARLVVTKMISDTVAEELEREKLQYESFVHLTYGEDKAVTAVVTDVSTANRFKAAVSSKITEALQQQQTSEFTVPLGTLLDNPYFNGRGPGIPFKLFPGQSAAVDFGSRFVSAGINQTQHQIILTVCVEAVAMIPGVRTHVRTETSFLIAETVIVGVVPDAYTEVLTSSGNLPNLIADYGVTSSSALQSFP